MMTRTDIVVRLGAVDGGWETASPNATLYGGGVAAPGVSSQLRAWGPCP